MAKVKQEEKTKKVIAEKTEKVEKKSTKASERTEKVCKKSKADKQVEDKNKTTKAETKNSEPKTKKPIYRVVYDKDARAWLIKKDGAKRTIASFPTKDEALARVKDLAESNELNFIVHKKDGKFQKK